MGPGAVLPRNADRLHSVSLTAAALPDSRHGPHLKVKAIRDVNTP